MLRKNIHSKHSFLNKLTNKCVNKYITLCLSNQEFKNMIALVVQSEIKKIYTNNSCIYSCLNFIFKGILIVLCILVLIALKKIEITNLLNIFVIVFKHVSLLKQKYFK